MRQVTYRGPGHRLRTASGRELARGERGEVTDADADALAAMRDRGRIDVTIHEPEADGTGQTDDNSEEGS